MSKSELIISIDNETAGVDVQLRSKPELRISFIGACTVAQDLIIRMLRDDGSSSSPVISQPRGLANHDQNNYNKVEDQVSKQKALEHYAEMMMNLQQRIKSINESDDRATFYIPLPSSMLNEQKKPQSEK